MPLNRTPPARDERGRFISTEAPDMTTQEVHDEDFIEEQVDLKQEVDEMKDSIMQMKDMMRTLLLQQAAPSSVRQRTPSPTLPNPLEGRIRAISPAASTTSSLSVASESSVAKELLKAVPSYFHRIPGTLTNRSYSSNSSKKSKTILKKLN